MYYEQHDKQLNKENSLFLTILNYFRQILVALKIFCTIRLADHGTKPGTAKQCKTKGSSCHRQSSVRILSGIRAAQSSVFCVHCSLFYQTTVYHFFLFRLAIALPARLRFMTSDNSFGIYKKTFLIWVIIKIHALFPGHILVTSNIFVPVLLQPISFSYITMTYLHNMQSGKPP